MKIYKSEIGIEMYLILALMSLFNIYILVSEGYDFFLLTIIFCPILFLIYVINATNYEIKNEILYINSSFLFKEKLQINDIRKIEEVINILSSPAMSIKRLELFYGKYDSILVSPKNKGEFIEALLNINNKIEVKLKK